ncbi:hypothetical protein P692DRAFT_20724173, partial [Suillus brevipes Sb2]
SAPIVEISNETLCTMTGNITWSAFGHTLKFIPMCSMYIAGIKYTTVSLGAMSFPPITRFHSQLFSGLIVAPSDSSRARTRGCRFLCRFRELQRCKIVLTTVE